MNVTGSFARASTCEEGNPTVAGANKKIAAGVLSLVVGLALALGAHLKVLATLGVTNAGLADSFVQKSEAAAKSGPGAAANAAPTIHAVATPSQLKVMEQK